MGKPTAKRKAVCLPLPVIRVLAQNHYTDLIREIETTNEKSIEKMENGLTAEQGTHTRTQNEQNGRLHCKKKLEKKIVQIRTG